MRFDKFIITLLLIVIVVFIITHSMQENDSKEDEEIYTDYLDFYANYSDYQELVLNDNFLLKGGEVVNVDEMKDILYKKHGINVSKDIRETFNNELGTTTGFGYSYWEGYKSVYFNGIYGQIRAGTLDGIKKEREEHYSWRPPFTFFDRYIYTTEPMAICEIANSGGCINVYNPTNQNGNFHSNESFIITEQNIYNPTNETIEIGYTLYVCKIKYIIDKNE